VSSYDAGRELLAKRVALGGGCFVRNTGRHELARGQHAHRCIKCRHVWSHANARGNVHELADHVKLHTCPRCGAYQGCHVDHVKGSYIDEADASVRARGQMTTAAIVAAALVSGLALDARRRRRS
jgi:hypothetical protein